MPWYEEEIRTQTHEEGRRHEDTGGRQPSTGQEEETNPTDTLILDFQPPELWKANSAV